MRDLVRAREAAVDDLRRKRQAISSMMLRQGRVYPGKRTWGARHLRWLQEQNFTHPFDPTKEPGRAAEASGNALESARQARPEGGRGAAEATAVASDPRNAESRLRDRG